MFSLLSNATPMVVYKMQIAEMQTALRWYWTVVPRPINISALMMKIKGNFYRSC